jgi:hypothetical protein
MSLPPIRATEPRLGTSNPVEVAATTDMVGTDEVGGKVVRVGVRFSETGMLEVWSYGSTGYAPEALQAVNHPIERRGRMADGRGYLRGLAGRICEELTPGHARSAKYLSREFVARDADGAGRSVGDFSHLSDHYSAVLTKLETLEGVFVSMRRHDTMLSMDLHTGYNHFRLHPAMRDYFVVSVKLMDGTVRYFRYFVLPFGWSRSRYWLSRLVSRFWTTLKSCFGYRVLSYVDDYLTVVYITQNLDKDGLSTSLSPLGHAVVALWANSNIRRKAYGVVGLKCSSIWDLL